ncbi:AAA family ATPase [Wukongibacter baidiensis]|uniref:AAA family ATPase n=1 Tax=Wukongibacter baidiensis TaxID=1723361 RepID=UPI003D7FA374
MAKLHLIIADMDEAYVESIANYITNNHSQRFQVTCFTKQDFLFDYFSKNKKKIDILLLCPEWYTDSFPDEMVNTPIILSRGIFDMEINDWDVINKYQKGDRLVSNIIDCFAERNPNKYCIVDGEKGTKVVAIYSPIGGCGKTSIAIGLGIKAAEGGKTVFYLNLEDIQSTPYYFNCETRQNFSNMLYYIKENKKNITMKIEGIRNTDFQYNIHYFSPPDNIMDLNETSPDEIKSLLYELKISNNYDLIVVDMSSDIDERNLSTLKSSDQIILVNPHDSLAMMRVDCFMKELDIFSKRNKVDLLEKITIALNKYGANNTPRVKTLKLNGKSKEVKIPMVHEPITVHNSNYSKELKSKYREGIDNLLRQVEENIKDKM